VPPAAPLYLHEVIDIVGQGAVPYMEQTLGFDTEGAAGRGLVLFGTWQVVGATGRWPQVVNVWELEDGWEGWRRLVSSTNLRREENEALSDWWDEAYRRRTGGFDRLLGPGPRCPTRESLRTAGVRGSLFVHELSKVRPGTGPEYLAAVADGWVEVLADHGHQLVGLWRVLLSDTEVVTVWATDLDAHVTFQQSIDPRIESWRATARQWLTGWREELLVPHRGTLLWAPP
jgi:hypothetical protein